MDHWQIYRTVRWSTSIGTSQQATFLSCVWTEPKCIKANKDLPKSTHKYIFETKVHSYWKVVDEPRKTPGLLATGKEFSPGPETRLDHSELLCDKILPKYKRDRERFWNRHQKGDGECPLTSVSNGVIYLLISYYNESKECLEVVKILLDPLS